MLEYDRIDISEGYDVNKTSASKECNICHYWYFKDIAFKYERYPSNGYHDLTQKAISLNDVAIVNGKRNAHRVHLLFITFVFLFENIQNSFSCGSCLVHSGL